MIEDEKYLIKIQERTAGKALGSALDIGQIEKVIEKNTLRAPADNRVSEARL